MTTYVITGDCNIDQLGTLSPSGSASARAGGDTIDTNGFDFTIDQDSRYGLTGTTSTSFGNMTINASKGGDIIIDARYVRLIPYNTGTGNVPAWNTTVSVGSASGKLIAVYSALTAAPTATGAAMPASGYIKIKSWNSTAFAAGAFTGIGASATGADVAGFIEIIADEGASAALTCTRLGTFRVHGAWYEFLGVTTDGTRATTYQIPSNGSLVYAPGVNVQSASATITAASFSGGSVTYTAAAHGFQIGQEVTVTGASPAGYNIADLPITAVTTDTFTVTLADPGAWTSGGSAYVYDWYPAAGSRPALVANIATDVVRGRWCWISTAGLVRFGHDGTNATGGYIVPSGRKLRIANIFTGHCTTAARTVNVIPNATPGTRNEFVTSGGGVVDIDKCNMAWYLNCAQAYSVNLSYCYTFEAMIVTECAAAMVWKDVGVGQSPVANTQLALTLGLNFAGGTIRNCTWTRIAQAGSGAYVQSWADCSGFTVTNNRIQSLTKAANATTGSATLTRLINCTFEETLLGGGRLFTIGCDTVTWTATTYYDNINGTTGTGLPMYVWDLGTAASYTLKFDGLDFGGLTLVQPYSGVLNIGVAGCSDLKLRNLGTAAAPLDMGGPVQYGTWTRSTTTTTVTRVAHGLKAGDSIAVIAVSDVAPKALTTSLATVWPIATVPTADTFTVTVTNAGQTTGQNITYYPVMAAALVNFVAGSAVNPLKIQRCYVPHLRSALLTTQDNSAKNVLLEQVWGSEWAALLVPMLNTTIRGMQALPALTAQTACYGTHWNDYYIAPDPTNKAAVSWARTTTVCTVTSAGHNLQVGNQILVTVTSSAAAVILGVKTLTQMTAAASPNNSQDTFTFACLNAGSASGTLTFTPITGRVAIQMNEATADTSGQVSLAGTAGFTSAGTLYMPTVNDEATFTMEKNLEGHGSFPIMEAVMTGGGAQTNFDVTYSRNGGTTYKNLSYPRAGAGGSNASTTVTMTSTTGVAVDDYVFGTNIAPLARVVSIDSGTNITVSIANVGTVSGILRFNQLPGETIADPTVGTPLKIKIKTTTANTTAISSIYFRTYSNSTARAATYPLDTAPVTITVRDSSTLAAVTNARVRITTDTGGFTVLEGLTDGSGVLTGTTEYTNHAISGTVRRASVADGTLYKPGSISGTTTSAGFSATTLMIADE